MEKAPLLICCRTLVWYNSNYLVRPSSLMQGATIGLDKTATDHGAALHAQQFYLTVNYVLDCFTKK